MMNYGNGFYGGQMTGGMFLMGGVALIFLLVVLAGAVFLAMSISRRFTAAPAVVAGNEAGDILRKRFAAGDIDDEEYKRRLAALSAK